MLIWKLIPGLGIFADAPGCRHQNFNSESVIKEEIIKASQTGITKYEDSSDIESTEG